MFRHLFGVLMNEAGDGGTGGGGESTALTTTAGTSVAALEGADDAGGDDSSGTGDEGAVALADANNDTIFDRSGRITQNTTKAFRDLIKTNPQIKALLGKAERHLGTFGKLTSMLGPKPFDRIKELTGFWKEVGGPQGLEALRATVADMEQSDALYEKSDPQLIAMMTETPAAKQAFVKLFPHSVSRMRELAPQTYTRWLGMQIVHALEKLDIVTQKDGDGKVTATEPIDLPFRLRRIFSQLPPADPQTGKFVGGQLTADQEQAIYTDLARIYSWVESMRAWSNATPEDLTPPKEDTSAAAIAKAKQDADNAIQENWRVQRDALCNELLGEEVRKQTKGMELSATETANITAKALASVNKIRRAQPDNTQKIQAYFDSKNVEGYLKYNKRIFEDNLQAEVEKAVRIYGKKPKGSAAAATTTTTATTTATTDTSNNNQSGQMVRLTADQMKLLNGGSITRYMKQPIGNKPGTTMDDIRKKQYILRAPNPWKLADGTRVQLP